MLFTKTICKPGAYIAIVPVGLQATLQYNKDGLLECIAYGYEETHRSYFTTEAVKYIIQSNIVPAKIPIKGGTTWISGVFYNPEDLEVKDRDGDMIIDNASKYTFYGGRVSSLAASFKSVLSIRNWLSMSKFDMLPGMLVKVGMTETEFLDIVSKFTKFPFVIPLFAGYMIFENISYRYHDNRLSQVVVDNISNKYDANGYFKSILSWKENEEKIEHLVDYSTSWKFNIAKGDKLVKDNDGKIIYNLTSRKVNDSDKIVCPDCGNIFKVAKQGPITCTDPHCISKLYTEIYHFTSILNLPEMEISRFEDLKANKEIMCLTDIFCLPEYEDCSIDVSMDTLLSAVVPIEVCRDASIFSMIWNKSDRSLQTFNYYLHNPDRIAIDLNLNTAPIRSVIEWFKDPYNISTITSLIDMKQINITQSNKKFDGPQIFRDKVIAITGLFKHGSLSEVSSILESYGAKVTTIFEDKTDCVVVGDLKENISGSIIHSAKNSSIPIFEESTFFAEYEIDDDLAKNLL